MNRYIVCQLMILQIMCNLQFLCVSVNVCARTLSEDAPISKSHLIIHAPQHEQLVFIKCQYVACTENECGITLPLCRPNH